MNDWFTLGEHGIWFVFDLHLVLRTWTPSPPHSLYVNSGKILLRGQTYTGGQTCGCKRYAASRLSFGAFAYEVFHVCSQVICCFSLTADKRILPLLNERELSQMQPVCHWWSENAGQSQPDFYKTFVAFIPVFFFLLSLFRLSPLNPSVWVASGCWG